MITGAADRAAGNFYPQKCMHMHAFFKAPRSQMKSHVFIRWINIAYRMRLCQIRRFAAGRADRWFCEVIDAGTPPPSALCEVGENVVGILNASRKAHPARCHAAFLLAHLVVSK